MSADELWAYGGITPEQRDRIVGISDKISDSTVTPGYPSRIHDRFSRTDSDRALIRAFEVVAHAGDFGETDKRRFL